MRFTLPRGLGVSGVARSAVSAGAMLLVAATVVQAQDRGGRDGGPRGGGGGGDRGPSIQREAPRMERTQPRAEQRTQRPERAEQPRRERSESRQAEPRREKQPQRAERERQRDNDARRERAQRQEQRNEQRKQAEPKQRPDRDTKQAAPKRDERPDRAAGRKGGGDRDNNQARNGDRQGSQQVKRVQASNEQRVRVRERIFHDRNVRRISRRDFGVGLTIGAHVHRRHHLHRMTPAILAFAPAYSGYSYVVVDDTICIVDPVSYTIVDVIPSSIEYASGGPDERHQLVLSAEEMHFIFASVPRDRTADVRIRLALGAEVPISVDLERFPDGVISRVPQVDNFRFIVVDDDVVVVDPYDRSVALVITE